MSDASDPRPGPPEGRVILGPMATDLPFMIRNVYSMLRPLGAVVRAPLKIESGGIGVLSLIWVNPGISQNDLAANLAIKKSAVTKLVKRLEAEGLVERRRAEGDRRTNALTLTSEGHMLMGEIRAMTMAQNDDIMSGIPREEREIFYRVLGRLHETLATRNWDLAADHE